MAAPQAQPDPYHYVFACPHCGLQVQVPRDGLNCQIFRHGAYKANPNQGIPPHAPKAECDRLSPRTSSSAAASPSASTATVCNYI